MESHFPPSDGWLCEQIALNIQNGECFSSGDCSKWIPDFAPLHLSSEGPSVFTCSSHSLRCMKLSLGQLYNARFLIFLRISWMCSVFTALPPLLLQHLPWLPSSLLFFLLFHRDAYWTHVTLLLCVLVGSGQLGLDNLQQAYPWRNWISLSQNLLASCSSFSRDGALLRFCYPCWHVYCGNHCAALA